MAKQNPPESELTIYDTDQFGADIYKQSNKVKLTRWNRWTFNVHN